MKCCVILGVISVETPQLLCELLDEIGRKDLSSLIKDYLHKRSSKLIVDMHVYTALVIILSQQTT